MTPLFGICKQNRQSCMDGGWGANENPVNCAVLLNHVKEERRNNSAQESSTEMWRSQGQQGCHSMPLSMFANILTQKVMCSWRRKKTQPSKPRWIQYLSASLESHQDFSLSNMATNSWFGNEVTQSAANSTPRTVTGAINKKHVKIRNYPCFKIWKRLEKIWLWSLIQAHCTHSASYANQQGIKTRLNSHQANKRSVFFSSVNQLEQLFLQIIDI